MKKHILGFPRIGLHRDLKKAQEAFWKGTLTAEELEVQAADLRLQNWRIQRDAGLDYVSVGDFSLYDHVLDTCVMLGMIPRRFRHLDSSLLTTYFTMARGDQKTGLPAMEMTKWFNTNYHYLVPELDQDAKPDFHQKDLLRQTQEAIQAGFAPKPVLLGPISFLTLAKGVDGFDRWQLLDDLSDAYTEILFHLAPLADWIQMDEPVLAGNLPPQGREAFDAVYEKLNAAAGSSKLLLTTYFAALDENLDLALQSGCAGLHIDLTQDHGNLEDILQSLPHDMTLSAGVVDGRTIWRNDFQKTLACLNHLKDCLGERMMAASSCSLLHVPVDLSTEVSMAPVIKSWLAFATEKCREVAVLGDLVSGIKHDDELQANQQAIRSRQSHPSVHHAGVQERMDAITPDQCHRQHSFAVRRQAQRWVGLPLFPTTTIGSFPQTAEIRRVRRALHSKQTTPAAYTAFMQQTIAEIIRKQEELGLDVLVHGEPERNDMVEYFSEQLDGFTFTENGWVQSYGSRCVKPPIIYGDVARPHPMTVEWLSYAQSLTDKPMKGMLTGPVTLLCWSFVRDDMNRKDVCRQIALAIRDEVQDLEQAGIHIIQIDEAAFSEGMPIKARDREDYLAWAVEAFRLATSGVADSTQIHTHMCYAEFNTILRNIADMDADVISIESSRSGMELLDAFKSFDYPNDIGPGVYDIHSPRIPSQQEIYDLLMKALEFIPAERLWVNPDCGLKTRSWEEVIPSLRNMVAAARQLRARYQS